MNKAVWMMILICLLLSGCTPPQTPTAAPTPKESHTDVPYHIQQAEKYRVTIDDVEYYFDTDDYIFDLNLEFPLFKQEKDKWPEYLGTTGFAFQVNGDYIYVQSDVLQEDWPDGTLTRVVNLVDVTIRPVKRNIRIFIPEEEDRVYYTWVDNSITVAYPSLETDYVIEVNIPDREKIEEDSGEDLDHYETGISIRRVENGWIYFKCFIFMYEGPGLYEGNYRITTDGRKIEKTDKGELFAE